ncbi:MAG: ABC transporter permease [Gemmatimonadaceae bacterium]
MRLANRLYSSLEGVVIAFESIRSNKVRAGLTIMGVAVGVFVVVAMSGAIHGIKASLERDLASSGPTTFFVMRRGDMFENCNGGDDACPSRRNPPISLTEVATLGRVRDAQHVVAHIGWGAGFKYRDRALNRVSVDGYTPNWVDMDGGDILPGRSFTVAENTSAARVVIVNAYMADRLFGDSDPVGKTITADGLPFQVIGVYKPPLNALGGASDDASAIMPMETLRRVLGARIRGLEVKVRPRDDANRDVVMDEVTATLRSARGLKPGARDNFAVVGQDQLMEKFNSFTQNFFLIMIGLASVALLVGGVGVVAIMMISVTERTREIGVRKALGATKGTILWQFLVEASTLTSIGAAVGLAIGVVLVVAIRTWSPIPAEVPNSMIATALIASALTGIVFGLVPAMRAARLDPVEALRHE